MKMIIKNGRVVDPANNLDKICDLAIDNGKIVAFEHLPENFGAEKTLDATDKWVIPGLIAVMCRTQTKHSQSTTLSEEGQAALKRGITSLCLAPDSEPLQDNAAAVLRKTQKMPGLASPHVYPIGALTLGLQGSTLTDLVALKEAGCIAFSNVQKPLPDLQFLRHCYEYAANFNLLVMIQPNEAALAKGGVAHEGLIATRLGLPGIPETAETLAIAQHLLLIAQTGVRAHFTCLSTRAGVDLIQAAKAQGLAVTSDTAMHSLHLSEMDLIDFNPNCHLYPPLRSVLDQAGLQRAVQENTIDLLSCDHRPLEAIAKLAPFGDTQPGLSALDTLFSLGLQLVNVQKLTLNRLILSLSTRPAQIFGLPGGSLSVGSPADLCLIDPKKYWTVTENTLFSKGKNTPFMGWQLPGVVTHTLIQGQVVYEHES